LLKMMKNMLPKEAPIIPLQEFEWMPDMLCIAV
jgi:hypothetical protein